MLLNAPSLLSLALVSFRCSVLILNPLALLLCGMESHSQPLVTTIVGIVFLCTTVRATGFQVCLYIYPAIASNIVEFGSTLNVEMMLVVLVPMNRIGAKTRRSRKAMTVELNI